jgi:hypothetical protein
MVLLVSVEVSVLEGQIIVFIYLFIYSLLLPVIVWSGILFWKQSSARGRIAYVSETLLCILTSFAIVSTQFLVCVYTIAVHRQLFSARSQLCEGPMKVALSVCTRLTT